MKKSIHPLIVMALVLWGALGNSLHAQEKPASADAILKEAFEQAGKENKNVLLVFHASWCGWCRKMDSSLNNASCRDFFLRNYVIKELTVYESADKKALENPGALKLLTSYKGNDLGIPFWVVLDKNGNLLGDAQLKPGVNSGCPATEEEVAHFINVLKVSSKMNQEEEERIVNCFRKNESR